MQLRGLVVFEKNLNRIANNVTHFKSISIQRAKIRQFLKTFHNFQRKTFRIPVDFQFFWNVVENMARSTRQNLYFFDKSNFISDEQNFYKLYGKR